MRYVYWARTRAGRLLVVLLAVLAYLVLLVLDVPRFSPSHGTNLNSLFLPWAFFSFSAFVALMFLAVGSLVWLYARDRRVALLLFGFSFTMVVVFATQTGNIPGNHLLDISGLSSTLAILLLSTLLLLFPKNYLSSHFQSGLESASEDKGRSGQPRRYSNLLPRGYLVILILLGIIVLPFSFLPLQAVSWLDTADNIYYAVGIVGILITIIISYRQSSSLRERQQQRLFVSGVILAFTPILLLTVIPNALNWPYLNGQFSSITVGLLPLALGYSILRYQVLVFDVYVRRAVGWIVGAVGLAILGYLVVVLPGVFLVGPVYVICVAVLMAVLGPCVWWLAHMVTQRLFFSEYAHYHQLVGSTETGMTSETFDLNEASQLLTVAAVNVFETQEVCLFVLDEDSGCYHLYPMLKADDPNDVPRRSLVQRLLSVMKPSARRDTDCLEANELPVRQVAAASRPLLLSEACKADEGLPSGLARYLATTSSLDSAEPLLAPVWSQGKMIAMLVLGERGDRQQYAGPDFEAIHLILTRFSPVVETARIMLKLRAAYERQKELDRLKDQFIITASHELRTPLTAVQGYIELLAAYNLSLEPQVRADFIAKANRGCDELTLMVGNIMDASRVEIDAENLKLIPVSLAESMTHVLEILEAVTRRENRNAEVDIPADVLVMADDLRLRQVLLNLVSNALKYSPAGSGFEITTDMDDEQITLRIRDHGLGVPLQDQERLFERFVRLERDMNSPVRGAGLGLYISKQLIEAMDGRIWVESAGIPGEGSTFAFTLKHSKAGKEARRLTLERQEV